MWWRYMATIALFMPDGHRRARCQLVDSPQVTGGVVTPPATD